MNRARKSYHRPPQYPLSATKRSHQPGYPRHMNKSTLPAALQKIVASFQNAPDMLKLPLLLEYAGQLHSVPENLGATLEQVHECQTPLFLHAEVGSDGVVQLHFDAPPEAPTTRGFAAIVQQGLAGLSAEEILAVPTTFHTEMGLAELISPLRIRGLEAIITRVKRQLRAQ